MADRSANRRRDHYDLPPDLIALFNEKMGAGAGHILNDRLVRLGLHVEAGSGLQGTVNIAAQSTKDQSGNPMPGMRLEGNRIGEVGDPIQDQDVVTYAFLKRQLECGNLTRILEECNDASEWLDDEVEPTTASGTELPHFWGVTINYYVSGTAGRPFGGPSFIEDGQIFVYPFVLPLDKTVSNITLKSNATGNTATSIVGIALYNGNKELVVSTEAVDGPFTSDRTITVPIDPPVLLTAGLYYQAETGDRNGSLSIPNARCGQINTDARDIFNSVSGTGIGIADGTAVGGAFPASFSTVTTTPTSTHTSILFPFVLYH